jgi:hypothetical protein
MINCGKILFVQRGNFRRTIFLNDKFADHIFILNAKNVPSKSICFCSFMFYIFLFAQLYEMQILIASAWLNDDDDQYKVIQGK